jgi:hypothetical protein
MHPSTVLKHSIVPVYCMDQVYAAEAPRDGPYIVDLQIVDVNA